MDNDEELEKIRYTGPGKGPVQNKDLTWNDIDVFICIGKLKTATDKKENFHLYKINCR